MILGLVLEGELAVASDACEERGWSLPVAIFVPPRAHLRYSLDERSCHSDSLWAHTTSYYLVNRFWVLAWTWSPRRIFRATKSTTRFSK